MTSAAPRNTIATKLAMKATVRLRTLLLATAAVASASGANALEYSYRVVAKNVAVVDAAGDFMPNEPDFMAHLSFPLYLPDASNPPAYGAKLAAVVFNSPGGAAEGGFAWAKYAEAHSINTGVAAGGRCASICVVAWAAGAHKSATPDASVGVHAASYSGNASIGSAMQWNIEATGTKLIATYLAQHGAPQSVVLATVTTPPISIHWLTPDEIVAWHVNVTY
jgi:hypothetical protein